MPNLSDTGSERPVAVVVDDLGVAPNGVGVQVVGNATTVNVGGSHGEHVPLSIILGLAGILVAWGYGLAESTPNLPRVWGPLAFVVFLLGLICIPLARVSDPGGFLVEKVDGLRAFLKQANVSALLTWASNNLDKFYGERVISWRAFRRSALVSTSAGVILTGILAVVVGDAVMQTAYRELWLNAGPYVLLAWLALNIVSDFLSVAFTRTVLTRVVKATRDKPDSGLRRLVGFIIIDTIILMVLALVPTGIAGSVTTYLLVPEETAAHEVIWLDYLIGSFSGTGADPGMIQYSVRAIVALTLVTACVPSLFVWTILLAAILAVPSDAVLYRGAARTLEHMHSTRQVVIWGYPMLAYSLLGFGLLWAEYEAERDAAAADLTLDILEHTCQRGIDSSCVMLRPFYSEAGPAKEVKNAEELFARAHSYYSTICEQGSAPACHVMGMLHLDDKGTKASPRDAFPFLERACNDDYIPACHQAGKLIANLHVEGDIERAISMLRRACERRYAPTGSRGSVRASSCSKLTDAAKIFVRGDSFHNPTRALFLWEIACTNGDVEGCAQIHYLALKYRRGVGNFEKDRQRALELYTQACGLGYMQACMSAGDMLLKGPTKDLERRAQMYLRACSGGLLRSCNQLGKFYRDGRGVQQDAKYAAQLFTSTCSQNDHSGCYLLGLLYREGQGVKKNLDLATFLFERSCNPVRHYRVRANTHDLGCVEAGRHYELGWGVEKQPDRAVALYENACYNHNARGCESLVRMLRKHDASVEIGPLLTRFDWWCSEGKADDCAWIGVLHESGRVIERDTKALEYYELGCWGGSPKSCEYVGTLRLTEDTKEGRADGIEFYGYACDMDEGHGCYRLGRLLLEGNDSERVRARELFERSCNHGNSHACLQLGGMYRDGVATPTDPKRAHDLFERSCAKHNGSGCESLGDLYLGEHGIRRDVERAIAEYEAACRLKRKSACVSLEELKADSLVPTESG